MKNIIEKQISAGIKIHFCSGYIFSIYIKTFNTNFIAEIYEFLYFFLMVANTTYHYLTTVS